jgi:hypothetical protein
MKSAYSAGRCFSAWRRLWLSWNAIMASSLCAAGAAVPLSACAEAPSDVASDSSIDLSPGGNYAAGITLRIPGQGWSFKVPAEWHATVFEDAELPFLISDEGRSMGMMFPLAHATAEDIERELAQPLSLAQGMVFVPTGALMRAESRLRRSYVSDTTMGRALAVKGPVDQWIIYFLMGPESESPAFDAVLDRLADSTQFEFKDGGSDPREGI